MPLCDDPPRVAAKTEELFLRWIGMPQVRAAVEAYVRAIKAGEPMPTLAVSPLVRRPESPPITPSSASPQRRSDGSSPRASISLPPRASVPRPVLRGLSLMEIPPFFTPKVGGLSAAQVAAVTQAVQAARSREQTSFFDVAKVGEWEQAPRIS